MPLVHTSEACKFRDEAFLTPAKATHQNNAAAATTCACRILVIDIAMSEGVGLRSGQNCACVCKPANTGFQAAVMPSIQICLGATHTEIDLTSNGFEAVEELT